MNPPMADYYVGTEGSGTFPEDDDNRKIGFAHWVPEPGTYTLHAVSTTDDSVYCNATVDSKITDWAWTPLARDRDGSLPPNITTGACSACTGGTPGPRAPY